ncbi:DUF4255 domain-containing protein [Dickeya zeae]|uniref:DUF4255 domain-containing protein n=1 Tax=Dickeya zeae TaxID=204042 RepID=UPI000310400D|nr:DUF4255 domain-containing protein [Dickeya zeae]AJC66186.1 hypothetical protein W909_08955 [Dickeya zeae EC1]
MIDDALGYIKSTLNQQLCHQFDSDGELVVVNNLVELNGGYPLKNQNKMVLTMINLEHETIKPFYGSRSPNSPGNTSVRQMLPPVIFNLDVLFTAHFDDYHEALKFLSATIAFFQATPTLVRQKFPDMPDDLTQLQFEIENSSYEKTQNLWSALGARYQPSIIYKIRHLTIQSNQIAGEIPVLQHITNKVSP